MVPSRRRRSCPAARTRTQPLRAVNDSVAAALIMTVTLHPTRSLLPAEAPSHWQAGGCPPAAHCQSDSLNISERARWVACRPHPRAWPPGYNPERPKNKQQYLRCKQWRCPRAAAGPLGRSGKDKGICSFFFSLCSPCSRAVTASGSLGLVTVSD